MKHIELYRRIAIILYETDYEVPIKDVCAYLNTEAGFFEQKKFRELKKYLKYTSGLPAKTLKKIEKAEEAAIDVYYEAKEYTLAQEYTMISNALHFMYHWEGFAENNPELYREAENCFHGLEKRIINECETGMADVYHDLMNDGNIPEELWEEAIIRYMGRNGFAASSEENEEDDPCNAR